METRNRIKISILLSCTAVILLAKPEVVRAQASSASTNHVDRKLVYRVDPYYPTDLKRLFIGGVVRLKIVVSAKGTVDTITPLGGNPAFVENSVAAVKKWKYSPADASTEMLINIDFDPRR